MRPPLPFEFPEYLLEDQELTFPAFMFRVAALCIRAAKEPFAILPCFAYSQDMMRRAAAPSTGADFLTMFFPMRGIPYSQGARELQVGT